MGFRWWHRDLVIGAETRRSALLNRQLAELAGFPSAKKAAERLLQHYRAGLVKRVPFFQLAPQGRPEFVYYSGPAPRARLLAHTIATAEVRVRTAVWLRHATEYSGEFFYDHELPRIMNPRPDAALILHKDQRSALIFFEVDNGTETVQGNAYSLARKLRSYATYFDAGTYQNDFSWAGSLRGFRVAFIVPPGRARHLQGLVQQEHHDFVLLTTPALLATGLHAPIWSSHEGRQVDLLGRPGGSQQGNESGK